MLTRYALLLLAGTLISSAADDLPVKLEGGNVIQLCADCAHREIRAAVTATRFVVANGEKPQILEVNLNGVRDGAWTKWFDVAWDPPVGEPTALVITVSDDLKRVGTYNVVLSLRAHLPNLNLQVVQPAAQLELPDKLLITRTQYWPWTCCEPESFAVDIRESSGLTAVSDLQFFNRQALQGTENVNGSIALDSGQIIPAGRSGRLGFQLRGDFPRGTVIGGLKLIAPQLAQPVALPYEVHTRLHPLYLLLSIMIGLFLSYLVRNQLQKRLVLAQARVQADDILQDVDDHVGSYDATIENALAESREALRTAAARSDPDAITRSAATLRELWKTSIDAFKTRVTLATAQVHDLQLILNTPWSLPNPIQASVQKTKAAADLAKEHLQKGKPDAALTALADVDGQLAADLRDKGLAWQNDARGIAQTVANATLGIPEPVRLQYAAILQQSPPELNRIKNEAISADPASLRRALEDLQTEYAGFTDSMERLAERMRTEWSAVENIWHAAPYLPHRDLLQQLEQEFLALADALPLAANDPASLRTHLPQHLGQLQEKWTEAITAQLPTGNTDLPQLKTELQARDFLVATRAMVAAVAGAQVVWRATTPQSSVAVWPARPALRPSSSITTIFNYSNEQPSAIPGLPRMRISRDLKSAQLLQTLVIGILTALWVFTSYSQTFDGTYIGLLAPLFATFLLDVSVEGLKNQIKDKRV